MQSTEQIREARTLHAIKELAKIGYEAERNGKRLKFLYSGGYAYYSPLGGYWDVYWIGEGKGLQSLIDAIKPKQKEEPFCNGDFENYQ